MKQIARTLAILTVFLLSPGSLYPVSHYYDDVGRLTQIAYPQGTGIRYDYDDNDNLLSTTTVGIPQAPQNLLTNTNENGGIMLTWDSVENITEYRIYRRRGSNLAWQLISGADPGTLLFLDTTTLPGIAYEYRIVTAGDEGLSVYSTPSMATSGQPANFRTRIVRSNASDDTYEIQFTAKQDSTSRLEFSNTLQNGDWSSQAYSLTEAGVESTELISNTEGSTSLYFSVAASDYPRFFRLVKDPE
jgi:YD repeat-containing protein